MSRERVAKWAVVAALLAGAAPVVLSSAASAGGAKTTTVWLCRPGTHNDPCTASLTTTVVPPGERTYVQKGKDAVHPPVDCFYVYPTVSPPKSVNANLDIQPAERSVAVAQASRFSADCRVFAPMYRQLTLQAILNPGEVTKSSLAAAYDGVQSAWRDYLAHYNDGRGFVLIGHSQGAAMLIELIKRQIDRDPAVRRRLVSAIILGGNVTVPIGKSVGGSFHHVPACRTATQTGCVVAYSSFDQTPPTGTLFGKAGAGASLLSGTSASSGLQVLCVDPARLLGQPTGMLEPYFPTASVTAGLGSQGQGAPALPTPWVAEPDLYSSSCQYQKGISWLQVNDAAKPGDARGVVTESLGPAWGLHLVDVNIALGNLVQLVHREALAYRS